MPDPLAQHPLEQLHGPERNAYSPDFQVQHCLDYLLGMSPDMSIPFPNTVADRAIELAHRLGLILPNAVFDAIDPEPFPQQ